MNAALQKNIAGLPGEPMVRKGLEDLAAGRRTIESLLIQIGAPRLRSLDVPVPEDIDHDADYRLYDLLCEAHGNGAHSQYNSWIRELVSFERALARRLWALRKNSTTPSP